MPPVYIGDMVFITQRKPFADTPSKGSDGADVLALERVFDTHGATVGFIEYVGRRSRAATSGTEYGWRPVGGSRYSLRSKRDAIRLLLGEGAVSSTPYTEPSLTEAAS